MHVSRQQSTGEAEDAGWVLLTQEFDKWVCAHVWFLWHSPFTFIAALIKLLIPSTQLCHVHCTLLVLVTTRGSSKDSNIC